MIALWVYLFKNCSNVLTQQTLKGYWDAVNYQDIFRVTIVIVKFLLSPSPGYRGKPQVESTGYSYIGMHLLPLYR